MLHPDAEQRFRDTIDRFGPALQRLVRGYETEPQRRAELGQDILLALWRALPTFRGDASLRTFVFRVAHNTAITHVSREARVQEPEVLDETVHATSEPGPAAAASRSQQRAKLEAAIRTLRPLDREVVLLHLEGLSNHEIAEITGTSATNVGTRLSRCRDRLHRAVGATP